jgi:hypothetical protein
MVFYPSYLLKFRTILRFWMRVTPPASGLLLPKINACFGRSKPEAGGVTLSQKRSTVLNFNECDGKIS